jgi:hypothetical protein
MPLFNISDVSCLTYTSVAMHHVNITEGSQSGYNVDLEFSASWVNNAEHWIGPDAHVGKGTPPVPNALYTALIEVVKQYR